MIVNEEHRKMGYRILYVHKDKGILMDDTVGFKIDLKVGDYVHIQSLSLDEEMYIIEKIEVVWNRDLSLHTTILTLIDDIDESVNNNYN